MSWLPTPSANNCLVYNYYAGTANPTTCTNTPPQPASGNNGNVKGYWYQDTSYPALSHNMDYNYDSLNRLIMAVGSGVPLGQSYSYDRYGNMVYTGGTGPAYGYDPSTNRMTSIGSTVLGYDAAGQMTWDGSYTYEYHGDGKLFWQYAGTYPLQYDAAEYYYNALGGLAGRYNGSTGRWQTVYSDPWGNETEVLYNGTMQEVYLPAVAGRHYAMYMNGNTYFTHANALGSTGMITDQAGAPIQGWFTSRGAQTGHAPGWEEIISICALPGPVRGTRRRRKPTTTSPLIAC